MMRMLNRKRITKRDRFGLLFLIVLLKNLRYSEIEEVR
jgi:hypothetical protein